MSYKIPSFRSATTGEIASFLGISRQAVGNKLHGKSEFTLNEVLKLYDVYGITMWDLKYIIEERTEIYNEKKERGLWQKKR